MEGITLASSVESVGFVLDGSGVSDERQFRRGDNT